MSFEIARPEVFIKTVHPESCGKFVLERAIDKRKKSFSQINSKEAEKLFKLSYKVPDLCFSIASFSGMPLLTNFENTRCLYLQFNYSPEIKNKVFNRLKNKGFPFPNAVITDGEHLTFLWVLEKAVNRIQYFKVFLLQHSLFNLLLDCKPLKNSLNVDTLIPLIGTMNSKVNGLVSLIHYTEDYLDNNKLESLLLRSLGVTEYERLKKHSITILELLAVFNDRVFQNSVSCDDWIVFFGASLCHFCSSEQLRKELQAIAVSVENKKWTIIKGQYDQLINSIVGTAEKGYILYQGNYLSFDSPDWFEIVGGKLYLSEEEINKLGLSVIAGKNMFLGDCLEISNIRPIGEMSFIPVERLIMRTVA